MTTKLTVNPFRENEVHHTETGPQHIVDLEWNSRGKWYTISRVTLTHNPDFPTPAISVIAPQPGIRFQVFDLNGNLVYSNKKSKENSE